MVARLEVSGLIRFTYWIIDLCCHCSSSISIDVWGYRYSLDWSPDVIPVVLLQEDVTSTGCRFYEIFRFVRSRWCKHWICVISYPERRVQFPRDNKFFHFSRMFLFAVFGSAQPPLQWVHREADLLPSSTVMNSRGNLCHYFHEYKRACCCSVMFVLVIRLKVKVKFTLEQATEVPERGRGIALLFL